MDNEKYGIELELIVGKFKQQIMDIQNRMKALDDTKIDMAKVSNVDVLTQKLRMAESELDTWVRRYEEGAKKIQNRMQYLSEFVNRVMRNSTGVQKLDFINKDRTLAQYTADLEKIVGKAEEAKIKVSQLKARLNESTGQKTIRNVRILGSSFNGLNKTLEKGVSKIKRFGLSLLSIRSMYLLVSRASSAYLSQDTELANKLQAAWIGLGAVLSPIIEGLATIILKVVSVINNFIKALTGVDLIAKATAKSMKTASGSANSLKKSLAGFDELTNLDSDTSAGEGLAGGILDAFKNVDDDFDNLMGGLRKTLDKTYNNLRAKMIKSIENMKVTIRKAGLSEEFSNAFDLGSRAAIDILDGFTGTLGGILDIITGILKGDKEQIYKGFTELIDGMVKIITGLPKIIVAVVGIIVQTVVELWNRLSDYATRFFIDLFKKIDNLPWYIRFSLNIGLGIIESVVGSALSMVTGLFKGIGRIMDGFVLFFKGDFGGGLISIGKGILNVFIGLINSAVYALNGIISPIRAIVVEIGRLTGRNWTMSNISIPRIPYLATGTNYVPEDQVAMIHKGEAVVPKKFNSQEYFGGTNDETNAKLDEVIAAIREIEINPYTTIKDVGRASLSYINGKSRQLGESVVM